MSTKIPLANNISVPNTDAQLQIPLVYTSLFPLLYLSLFSQRHAPQTTTKFHSEYHYIIVGAGSGGATLAARLSEEACVNVLLLEAGRTPSILTEVPSVSRAFINTDIDWGYYSTPQKYTGRLLNNRQVYLPAGRAVGGSSIINAMLFARGSRKIYNDWQALGSKGWSYPDMLHYFKKLEMNTNPESLDIPFHGFKGPLAVSTPNFNTSYKRALRNAVRELGHNFVDPNGKYPKGFYDYQMSMRNGQRCSVAKAYLVLAENRTNLDIVESAYVTKVVCAFKMFSTSVSRKL